MKALSNSTARQSAVLLLLAVLLALLMDYSGLAWRVEHRVADAGVSLLPQEAPQDIVIVAVDEKSLRKFGRWPWSRQIHAQLLNRLKLAGAGLVAFDVLFAEASKTDSIGDQLFAAAIARYGKVILAMGSEEDPGDGKVSEVLPLPAFADATAGIGHTDMAIDKDGVVRGTYLFAGAGVARWPGLALAALDLSARPRAAEWLGERFSDQGAFLGTRWVRDHRVLFPYAGRDGAFPVFSLADVVEGKIGAEVLQGKTVFVGVTAAAIRRVFTTPGAEAMSGVEIHANIFNALKNDAVVLHAQGWFRLAGLIILSLAAVLVLVYGRFNSVFYRLCLAMAVSGGLSLLVLMITGLLLPVVPVWTALVVTGVLGGSMRIGGLRKNSSRDALTGLCNRSAFETHFGNMWRLNERRKRLLFLLLVDLDHFKRFNDMFGHLQGDEALKALASYLDGKTRHAGDRVCRVGGEEFAVLLDLEEPDLQQVEAFAQEIVDGVQDLEIRYRDGDRIRHLTVSVGCAGMVPGPCHTREELFDMANRALFQAKNAGRNRVHCRWSEKRPGATRRVFAGSGANAG
ncbi:CHASE2 domain-containing protein [Thiolapillus sp.]